MHEDLEQRIRAWRSQLAAELKCNRKVLDELESHLREELERSPAPTVEQAWAAALAKLGDARALAAEFAKVGPTGWLPARLVATLGIGLVLMMVLLTSAGLVFAGGDLLLTVHVSTVLLGYQATMLIGALGFCFAVARPFSDWHEGHSRSFRRLAVPLSLCATACTGLAMLLGMVWAAREWGVAWSWDPKEVGALAVGSGTLAFAALLAWRGVPDRVLMALAIFNNIVVCLAWFHPVLGIVGPEALHIYGWSAFAPVLIAALVVQVALVALVAMPARWLRSDAERRA